MRDKSGTQRGGGDIMGLLWIQQIRMGQDQFQEECLCMCVCVCVVGCVNRTFSLRELFKSVKSVMFQ